MELGFMEMVVIVLAILLLFGPDKLPQIARDLGSGVRKMRGAVEDIKTEIMKETEAPVNEIKKEIEKVKDAAKDNFLTTEFEKKTEEATTNEPKVDPMSEEYQGPVSR